MGAVDRKALGAKIRAAREAKGLNQTQLGALVGVGQTAVSQWEAGERNFGVEELAKLERALGVGFGASGPDAESAVRISQAAVDFRLLADMAEQFAVRARSAAARLDAPADPTPGGALQESVERYHAREAKAGKVTTPPQRKRG